MITLTRLYRFSASHRLHVAHMSQAENAALFGKCNNPFGHGHDYVLSITVTGPVSSQTGLLISNAALDRLVEEQVLRVFSFCNINTDVPQFQELVPTTENLALVIADLLEASWLTLNTTASLLSLHVQETARNGFEVNLGVRNCPPVLLSSTESVTANA